MVTVRTSVETAAGSLAVPAPLSAAAPSVGVGLLYDEGELVDFPVSPEQLEYTAAAPSVGVGLLYDEGELVDFPVSPEQLEYDDIFGESDMGATLELLH
jgi:hypothetical protein